jgi:hypothetical protein
VEGGTHTLRRARWLTAAAGHASRVRRPSVSAGIWATLLAGAVIIAQAGCSKPAAAPPSVAPENLDAVLLTAGEINTVMGASGMASDNRIRHDTQRGSLPTVSDPECLGVIYSAVDKDYRGSKYSAVSFEQLSEPGDHADHVVQQAAVSFPSTDQALAFVKREAAKWKSCGGHTLNGH